MKIVVIHPIFKPYVRGGAEVVVENIVQGLKKDHTLSFITLGYQDKQEEIDGVKVFRIKPFNLFNFLDINSKPVWLRLPWHIIDMFSDVQAWKIFKILNQEKPDLVLTHNLKGLGYYTPSILRILKIRNIHTVHDMQLLHPSGLLPKRKSLLAWKYRFWCRLLFNSPDQVIFPSEYIKKIYEKFGFFKKSKKIVLSNPIVKIDFNKKQNQNLKLLFLGQVEEYKGILDLIDAVKGFGDQLSLDIVGDGQALLKAKNKAQGSPQIKFWGRLTQEQLAKEIWPQTDVLVNPSRTEESFGMVVIEALAHGIPSLVSNHGALPELITLETGWVFKDDLKEKIQWILDHREEVEKRSSLCLKEAEKYLLENYLKKLLGE